MTAIRLNTPLKEKDVLSLNIGDVVLISGRLFTARSQFHIHFIDKGNLPPLDLEQNNVMLHSGPIIEKMDQGWAVRAMSVTTSIRFDKWSPEAIRRLGLRALIGKGEAGKKTREAMKAYGCVHLGKMGLFGGALATKVEAVEEVHWMELGLPEAIWVLQVRNFGPFVVTADTKGKCLFDQVSRRVSEQLPNIYQKLGIDVIGNEKN